MLYEAERAIGSTNELAAIESKVKPEYEKCKKELAAAKSNKKGSIPLLLILLGVTVLLFFGSAASINKAVVLRNICRILLVIAGIADISVLSEIVTAPGRIRRAEEALAKAEKDLADNVLFQNMPESISASLRTVKPVRKLRPEICLICSFTGKNGGNG